MLCKLDKIYLLCLKNVEMFLSFLIWYILLNSYVFHTFYVNSDYLKLQEFTVISASFVKSVRTEFSKLGKKNIPPFKKKRPSMQNNSTDDFHKICLFCWLIAKIKNYNTKICFSTEG